jgi:4-hydroxybenzoate decarboxylase
VLYTQLEYKVAAVMRGKPYRVVKNAKGLDLPWGSEYILEGRILSRRREPEGPFGEFPGYYKDHSRCEVYRRVRGHRQTRRPSIPNRRRLILQAITKNRR